MSGAAAAGEAVAESEAALALRWAAGVREPLRLVDGRRLQIVFPGVPGGPAGPDFRGAILDAGGDLLQGDVELHCAASGWRAHHHHRDPAYSDVVLHVVGENDTGAAFTLHGGARAIPVLVLPPQAPGFPPPFVPPCALEASTGDRLEALSRRRLRARTARAAALVLAEGAGQALYRLALEQLGGSANRAAFGAIAARLPLSALLEGAGASAAERALAITALLKGASCGELRGAAGGRPAAAPGQRLDLAGRVFAAWWPRGAASGWPAHLAARRSSLLGGTPRGTAIELAVNAIVPVALATGAWREDEAWECWRSLPSPGTYGVLRPLERWLGHGERAFVSAARLQGGLLLHRDYCTRGACGRCPLVASEPAR